MAEPPPIDLTNNPHLRGADARFRAGGENPVLYRVIPPRRTDGGTPHENTRAADHITRMAVENPDATQWGQTYMAIAQDMNRNILPLFHPVIDLS